MGSVRAPESREDFKVAVICALPIEVDAVEALYDECWDDQGIEYGKAANDTNAYTTGRLGRYNIVLVHMPGIGKGHAASVAASLRSSFTRIQLALLVGICGVVPYGANGEEIIFGDVVISEGVVQYDLGRRNPDGFLRKDTPRDSLARPIQEIRSMLAKLKSRRVWQKLQERMLQHYNVVSDKLGTDYPGIKEDQLFPSTYRHKHQDPAVCELCGNCRGKDDVVCAESRKLDCQTLNCSQDQSVLRKRHAHVLKSGKVPDPVVHFGLIASADTVLKSAEDRDDLSTKENVIAFEMEAAGIWDNLPCVAVKGACDYADSHKSKTWQKYAAANAACCTKALLEQWVIDEDLVSSEHRLSGFEYQWPSDIEGREKGSRKPAFMIPFDRDEDFIGRSDTLDDVERSLVRSQRRVVLSGIGGVGKSQIAIEYCYRHKAKYPNVHIFWVHAGSLSRFQQAYLEIANYMGIGKPEAPATEVMTLVSRRLEDSSVGSWLMVIDNADSEDLLFEEMRRSPGHSNAQAPGFAIVQYLPRSLQGAFLMTTRNKRVGRNFSGNNRQMLHVQQFDHKDAVDLLRKKLDEDIDLDEARTKELVDLLAFLPLTLSQAAAYINQEGINIERYLAILRDCNATRQLLKVDYYDSRREFGTPNAIFLTWQLSFQEISTKNRRAAEMLSHMAFLDRKSIPAGLVRTEGEGQVSFDTAMGILKAYYFVKEERHKGIYGIHPLVQECTQGWLETQRTMIEWQEKALQAVFRACPLGVNFEHWTIWESIRPHAELVLRYPAGSTPWMLQRGYLLTNLAKYDRKRGHLDASFKEAQDAIAILKNLLGNDDPKTLEAMEVLMLCFRSRRDFRKAEEIGRKLVQAREEIIGENHPQTLTAMGHLIYVLSSQKKTDESEKLSREVLARTERREGNNHPDRLCAINDLAVILCKNGKDAEAEEISRELLDGLQGSLDKEHPQSLRALDNLGNALMSQRKDEEAEKVLREASQLNEKFFGNDHDATLSIKNSFGIILLCRGKSHEARQVLEEVLDQRENLFGKEHPSTQRAAKNLASIPVQST